MDRGQASRALADLVTAAVDGGVRRVEEIHTAIARRPFRAVERAGLPVSAMRAMHDGITAGVYATIRVSAGIVGAVARAALGAIGGRSRQELPAWVDHGMGAVGGMIGDRLEAEGSELTIRMELRHDGRPLTAERAALADAFPDAGGRIAIFVHGLCGTEHTWRLYNHEPYGARLCTDLGHTPLYVRYNSGLHVSANGRHLADLLAAVAESWPVALEEIVLIGHSMGGLVARSACHYGDLAGRRWVPLVRHVVCLGSPHLGTPLEKLANVGAFALGLFAETRPFATILNGRSAGIKDLRFGYLVDEEWHDADPDALLRNARREVPLLDSAAYHFVSATITESPHHPVALLVGDTLVRTASASGRAHWRRSSRRFASTSHLRLLNDPAVYEQLREWIAQPIAR